MPKLDLPVTCAPPVITCSILAMCSIGVNVAARAQDTDRRFAGVRSAEPSIPRIGSRLDHALLRMLYIGGGRVDEIALVLCRTSSCVVAISMFVVLFLVFCVPEQGPGIGKVYIRSEF